MPPAFNLSQDQTLQFNLCFVPSLAGSCEPSLTQNTDSCVLANLSVFLLREHLLYNLSIPAYQVRRRTPSSAHTYRLLVFKELQFVLRRPLMGRGCEALCSSAAERQDYAAFRVS